MRIRTSLRDMLQRLRPYSGACAIFAVERSRDKRAVPGGCRVAIPLLMFCFFAVPNHADATSVGENADFAKIINSCAKLAKRDGTFPGGEFANALAKYGALQVRYDELREFFSFSRAAQATDRSMQKKSNDLISEEGSETDRLKNRLEKRRSLDKLMLRLQQIDSRQSKNGVVIPVVRPRYFWLNEEKSKALTVHWESTIPESSNSQEVCVFLGLSAATFEDALGVEISDSDEATVADRLFDDFPLARFLDGRTLLRVYRHSQPVHITANAPEHRISIVYERLLP